MDDLKVFIIPAISFCFFVILISFYFLYSIGEIRIFKNPHSEIQQNQGMVTIEEFQKAMNTYSK